ncbi:hypothetical protein EV13_3088 [Prochlorococcus sp. MIT 0702]|nr:hypothetical protein EV13_3088 [Prochlorococcus sp. MIT 0702]KGG30449.1 hypothetical protein EV14_3022 [Prochlorococcus sp. MIT 0703]
MLAEEQTRILLDSSESELMLLQRSVTWKLQPDGSKRFARAMS